MNWRLIEIYFFLTHLQFLIRSYQYGDGDDAGRDDALQELEFSILPPVLYIQLKRFKYNLKSHNLTKINKKFEFDRKLDLSRYCDDANYTLHSVLGE